MSAAEGGGATRGSQQEEKVGIFIQRQGTGHFGAHSSLVIGLIEIETSYCTRAFFLHNSWRLLFFLSDLEHRFGWKRRQYMQTMSHIGLISIVRIVIQSTEAKLSPTLGSTNKSADLKFLDKHWGEKRPQSTQSRLPASLLDLEEISEGCKNYGFWGIAIGLLWCDTLATDLLSKESSWLKIINTRSTPNIKVQHGLVLGQEGEIALAMSKSRTGLKSIFKVPQQLYSNNNWTPCSAVKWPKVTQRSLLRLSLANK